MGRLSSGKPDAAAGLILQGNTNPCNGCLRIAQQFGRRTETHAISFATIHFISIFPLCGEDMQKQLPKSQAWQRLRAAPARNFAIRNQRSSYLGLMAVTLALLVSLLIPFVTAQNASELTGNWAVRIDNKDGT